MDAGEGPAAKKARLDGSLDKVDRTVLLAAQDHEKWIADRRRKWPSAQRVAEKLATEAARPADETANRPPSASPAGAPVGAPGGSHSAGGRGGRAGGGPVLCRYFLRGKCNLGARCRYSHERPTRPPRPAHERVYKRFEAPTKASLFVRLLQSDHDVEDARLLSFIEYMDRHNYLSVQPAPESQ